MLPRKLSDFKVFRHLALILLSPTLNSADCWLMFASGMDSAREAGEVGRVVQIPMQFMWPHGGRSVHLAGSFTRWTQFVPMSQLEGCPNVFQTVWSVTPGYHQYKFFVDGVWRHDERLPYVNSEHGIVNTLLLATEPAFVQPSPETVMDVDNDALRHRVRISDVASNLVIPRISEDDLRVSCQRVSLFLSTHTAYDLLPDSGKVVVLDVDLPVKQAFHILHEQGIPMAPLWDSCKGQFVGVLSAMDFILILRELGNHGSDLTEEQLETHTISAWKDEKAHMNRKVDGHGRPLYRQLIQAEPYDKLKDVALKVLENEVSTIPIIHSSSEDGSFPQLLHLATLSGILKCICRHFRHCSSSLPALQLPICAIPIGTWVPRIGEPNRKPLVVLRQNASLSSALNLLLQAQVSSIPIVDDNDALLDIYCRSDITALAKDRTYTHINPNENTLCEALQLRQDSHLTRESRSQRLQMCLRTDSLHKVMERLSTPGVRRVVVVEAGSNRVEGIISLTDVFRFLLG